MRYAKARMLPWRNAMCQKKGRKRRLNQCLGPKDAQVNPADPFPAPRRWSGTMPWRWTNHLNCLAERRKRPRDNEVCGGSFYIANIKLNLDVTIGGALRVRRSVMSVPLGVRSANRLRTAPPKIGIRPTIDGRRNGVRQPYVVATENDCLNGVSMLLMHLLTGAAQMFSDVRTFWSPDAVERVTGHMLHGAASGGIIHLINSGASALDWSGRQTIDGRPVVKPWWEITPAEAESCLAATRFCPADLGYFRGGGFSSEFLTWGGMPCTMARLNMVKGLGPVLQIAEGWTVDLPEDANRKLELRTSPGWPTTWFAPRITGVGPFADVYSVMNNWGANHGAIGFGHIGADLITLASILRIPVDMHNVSDGDVFRPAVWAGSLTLLAHVVYL